MAGKLRWIMPVPVCLIDTDVNGMLGVRKEAKDILDRISEPVVVVSVVGLYRTGKSYLMNRLAGRQSGFPLGNTIQSKTKGIWMWCLPHPCKARHTLVLLDTEGLGDIEKGDEKHDTWIFCLALLLSSTLVYNSLGVIDNMALEKLHYVTELKEHIRMKANAGGWDETGQFKSVFPAFVWTVRDFCLELEKDNRPITADQYLEGALQLKRGNSPRIEQYNLPRRCLQNLFVSRKCFVFPRPAAPKNMKRMEQLTEAELDPEFLQQANTFCQYIHSTAKSKSITQGRPITGCGLGDLAEVYVQAIRSGNVPCLQNAVNSLAKIQNGSAVDEALQLYVTEMKTILFPVNLFQLSSIHVTTKKKAFKVFIRMSFNDAYQTYRQQLAMNIQTEYEGLCEQNKEASKNVCQCFLQSLFEPLENILRNGYYMRTGGYQQYQDTLTQLTTNYRSQTRTQIMSEEVLSKYLEEKEASGRMILETDKYLTAVEHQKEVEKQRQYILEQRQRHLEAQNLRHQQMLEEQQRAHNEHVRQLMERRRIEKERLAQENQQMQEAKLREQELMLENSFRQETASLQRKIDREYERDSSDSSESSDSSDSSGSRSSSDSSCCIL